MVRGKCVIFLNHEWNGNLSLSLPLQNMSKFVLHKIGNTTKLKTIGFFHWPLWQCRVNSLHADLIFHYKLLSWAELSLMYRLWNQSRPLWFATRAGAVTTWPTCDNPLFTLNCQNYIWLEITMSEWIKSFDSKMSLMVMEWLLIVQSHNTDPHSQVLFPAVNEDT